MVGNITNANSVKHSCDKPLEVIMDNTTDHNNTNQCGKPQPIMVKQYNRPQQY